MNKKQIADILLEAMDKYDDFHTPSVGELMYSEFGKKIEGGFKSSLANYYHGEKRTFEIEGDICRIWKEGKEDKPPVWMYDFKAKKHLEPAL